MGGESPQERKENLEHTDEDSILGIREINGLCRPSCLEKGSTEGILGEGRDAG